MKSNDKIVQSLIELMKTHEFEEITVKNLKRPISRESTVTEEKDGFVRVMGTDGKEFLLNLKSGRIKKL